MLPRVSKTGKLELTWVGKEQRPRLEPRLLLEDPGKSYGDPKSPNMLIRGDNLLALKALELDFTGQFQCIYIDPPFNTGQAMADYEDGLEHSIWLTIMRDRLELLHRLLRKAGTIFVHIDDNELGYLIPVMDEIFQRENRISIVTFKQGAATGHKSINPGCVNTSNFVLIYAKDKASWKPNRVFTGRERDKRYSSFIVNRKDDYRFWKFTTLGKAFAQSLELTEREAKKSLGENYEEQLNEFVISHADSVIQPAPPNYDAISEAARKVVDASLKEPKQIFYLKRDDYSDMYFVAGKRLLFYREKLKQVDGVWVAGEPLTTIWTDILSNNLHNEGGVELPKGKKPEALIKRVLELSTKAGDWILDSFAGSGTTAAVAHKMGRRWITIEMGIHCDEKVLPRLRRVVEGNDPSGITEATKWKGGGGFKYFELAESLLVQDKALDVFYVNPKYDVDMLIRAICKVENFRYRPSGRWHGYSSETHFIHVVTQILNQPYLEMLAADLGEQDALLVYCTKRDTGLILPPNVKIKRIPKDLLAKCEFRPDLK
jgi:adenine-specific DNA-methyltransferase